MRIASLILPVVIGSVTGIIAISSGEIYLHHLFPYTPGTNENEAHSLALAIKQMPAKAFQLLLVNYMLGSFLAGFIATLLARRINVIPAIVVGVVLTLSAIFNIITLPHPLWFSVANLMVYLPFSYFGYLVIKKKVNTPDSCIQE